MSAIMLEQSIQANYVHFVGQDDMLCTQIYSTKCCQNAHNLYAIDLLYTLYVNSYIVCHC